MQKTLDSRSRWYLAAAVLLFFIAFVCYALTLDPQAPFMDTLRFLNSYDDSERGIRSLWTTWNQGEHRGMLPQTLVYWNAKLFGLNLFAAMVLIGLVIGITGWILLIEMGRTINRPVALWAAVFLTLCALYSLSNWEVYSVDVGAALFAKNLAFILYWLALTRALATRNRLFRVSVILAGPAIILLIAYGWSYAFAITSIFCTVMHGDRRASLFKALVCGSLIAAICAYVMAGKGMTGFDSGALKPSLLTGVASAFYASGSAFFGIETLERLKIPAVLVMPFGFLLLGSCAYALMRFVHSGGPILPIALMLYGCLDVAAVAYARGRYSPLLAMSSRYYMDFSFAVIGVTWWMAIALPSKTSGKIAIGSMLVLFVTGQAITTLDEMRMAPYRHAAFERMKESTRKGVLTPADAALLQQEFSTAQRAANVQRDRKIGAFRE